MGATKLEKFGGMLPLWDAKLLPEGQAAALNNGFMFSGALQGWITPTKVRNLLNSAARFCFRIPVKTESQSFVYIVFTANPIATDTLWIGEFGYTFESAASTLNTAFTVLIGATPAQTAQNLLNAITQDFGASTNEGVTYGTGTTGNTNVNLIGTATDNELRVCSTGVAVIQGTPYSYVQLFAPDFGASFNSVDTACYRGVSTVNPVVIVTSDLLSLADTTTTMVGGTNPSIDTNINDVNNNLWMEFLDQDTTVVKSQVVDDQYDRYYFASPSQAPQYNTYERIQQGQPAWQLGVPAPGCAPSVTPRGGGNYLQAGLTTSNGGAAWIGANRVHLYPVIPTGSSLVDSIRLIPQSTDPNVNWVGVVYQDAAQGANSPTAPGNLIGIGNIRTGFVSGTATGSSFTNPVPLEANTPYWIGLMTDTQEQIQTGDANLNTVMFDAPFTNGPPIVAPAVTTGRPDYAMWALLQTSDVIEARAYVYTWVTAYDEEGPPSPPTLMNGWSNGTWAIGLFEPPLGDQPGFAGRGVSINRNITSVNIYRTVTGVGGGTVYFFVANVPLNSVEGQQNYRYQDSALDSVIALNIQLPSTNYFPPPEDLQGFLNLPNGVTAAWKNNEVWFCQPYFPHAWPPGYVIAVDFPIVGLGYTQGAIVVCTTAFNYVIQGAVPGQMSAGRCSLPNPCVSRASIVSTDNGVFFSSPNGLIQISNTGIATNTTDMWVGRTQWNALTPSKYLRAIPFLGNYICFGSTSPASVQPADNSVAQQGFSLQLANDSTSFTIWPQPGGHRVGFSKLSAPNGVNVDNLFTDPWSGVVCLIQSGALYQYDFTNPSPTLQVVDYTSKIFQANTKKSYAAMKCFFTVPSTTPAQNQAPNEAPPFDPSWATLQPGQYGIIKVFADGVLVICREIRTSGGLLRLPSGFKCENWQFEIISRVIISNLQFATTAKELANV